MILTLYIGLHSSGNCLLLSVMECNLGLLGHLLTAKLSHNTDLGKQGLDAFRQLKPC